MVGPSCVVDVGPRPKLSLSIYPKQVTNTSQYIESESKRIRADRRTVVL